MEIEKVKKSKKDMVRADALRALMKITEHDTTAKAAAALKISPGTVATWLRNDRMPAHSSLAVEGLTRRIQQIHQGDGDGNGGELAVYVVMVKSEDGKKWLEGALDGLGYNYSVTRAR